MNNTNSIKTITTIDPIINAAVKPDKGKVCVVVDKVGLAFDGVFELLTLDIVEIVNAIEPFDWLLFLEVVFIFVYSKFKHLSQAFEYNLLMRLKIKISKYHHLIVISRSNKSVFRV